MHLDGSTTAVTTRVPRDGTSDGESSLHPHDIKCLHMEDAHISRQVRVGELTETVHLNAASSPSLTVDDPTSEISAGRKLAVRQKDKMSGGK